MTLTHATPKVTALGVGVSACPKNSCFSTISGLSLGVTLFTQIALSLLASVDKVSHQVKEISMKMWVAVLFAGVLVSPLFVGQGAAQDKKKDKEVSLKGKVTCAKCDLGLEKNCTTVIVVKESGKDVVYYFDTKANKDYHSDICSDSKPGEVTGAVSEKDGKKTITVNKLKYDSK